MAGQIKNLNIGANKKTQFIIDGNENKVIEIDASDTGIIERLNDSLQKIEQIQSKWEELGNMFSSHEGEYNIDETSLFSEQFAECERMMRDVVDDIFDSRVCDIILGRKSIFSLENGHFMFEVIIDALASEYESNTKVQVQKLNKRQMSKHAAKYIGK